MTELNTYLEQVEQREQAATPGPWSEEVKSSPRMIQSEGCLWDCGEYGMKPSWIANTGSHYNETEKDRVDGNSAFIANARQDIPTLLSLVRVLVEMTKLHHVECRYHKGGECNLGCDYFIRAALPGEKA